MYKKQFYDRDHARRYLSHSIIRVSGNPVFVVNVYEDGGTLMLQYQSIPDGMKKDPISLPLYSDTVDMTPVPLGFINNNHFGRHYVYKTYRVPMRMWKIGLCIDNFHVEDVNGNNDISRSSVLYSKNCRDTVINKFPAYNEVIDKLLKTDAEDMHFIAFSRRFAIDNTLRLWHIFNRKPVGQIKGDNTGLVKLNEEHEYLTQVLQKDMLDGAKSN